MTQTLLATKLFAPPPALRSVERQRLMQRLDAGLPGKLSLVCAPAGFGKSTLLGAWVQACEHPSAWLSLDEGERDPDQFVAYLTASLRSIAAELGDGALALAQARPRPTPEAVLTHLINRLATRPGRLVLVLDDYHLASCPAVDALLAFLLERMPAHLHLVLASRALPAIALARWRAQGQLLELGQDDLRFQAEESAQFLNHVMALGLSEAQVQALAARTEAWPAGLQMAALSLAGQSDAERFIQSFSGNHRLVQDYLLEEVLRRQSPALQCFLLRTSLLDRMCPDLCDAVMQSQSGEGREMLRQLEAAGLFIVPLDEERRWFRYHHLFGAMLRQRLSESEKKVQAALHLRATAWYEAQGMIRDALHHAVAAGDTARAMQVVQGDGMPLYFLEDAEPVLQWLRDQPPAFLDAHPPLWLMLAWSYLATSQHSLMRAPMLGAQAAIEKASQDPAYEGWCGELNAVRAWEAVARGDAATIAQEAALALQRLPQTSLALRVAAQCALGVAHQFHGERAAAQQVYGEVLAQAQACGNRMIGVCAAIALGHLQEDDNQLHLAARTYGRALQLLGDQPHGVACEVHLGLARIRYQWNELEAAASHAEQSSRLAALLECDAGLGADALRAQMLLSRAESDAALEMLKLASAAAQTRNQHGGRLAIAQVQVQAFLQTGEVMAAAELAQTHALPLAQAQVLLARGQAMQALECLNAFLSASQATAPAAELVRALLLKALALDAFDPSEAALTVLGEAMSLAEPQGWVRAFVDLGRPMQRLLEKAAQGARPRYTALLLDALRRQSDAIASLTLPAPATLPMPLTPPDALAEPLSQRELEVLTLIYKGLSNQEIGKQLFVSLSTVKWHNQNIFDKLDVQRRTEAVARAQALNLL
ncbi:LuxR C-terminal-related transcriptional regulator [Paucibacter sp. B2R-40]|uniref:LuxR C-terminal-related transcriptional regulator n=1 Tax=Paucibacter sp. B2R-40 TaxID=2893554 RepID=UPI0021E47739|nr:LuxR C-terminal-related transcriptional regulator [Paucibacter sp. B2R-40]MCV2353475.1 LuxR C-terminal-related transcriptional regulator [Paucibacter sp. B2R-40]